ncbi:MAG: hypothetical protein ACOCV8_02820 [Spirochaetota bacterium]
MKDFLNIKETIEYKIDKNAHMILNEEGIGIKIKKFFGLFKYYINYKWNYIRDIRLIGDEIIIKTDKAILKTELSLSSKEKTNLLHLIDKIMPEISNRVNSNDYKPSEELLEETKKLKQITLKSNPFYIEIKED